MLNQITDTEAIKAYLSAIGKKGGSVSSDAKREANRKNGLIPKKPKVKKNETNH